MMQTTEGSRANEDANEYFELKYKFFADYSETFINIIDYALSCVFVPFGILLFNVLISMYSSSNYVPITLGVLSLAINWQWNDNMFIRCTKVVTTWHDEVRLYSRFMEESIHQNDNSRSRSKKNDKNNPLTADEEESSAFVDLHELDDFYYKQVPQQLKQDQKIINRKHFKDRVIAIVNVIIFLIRLYYCDLQPTYGWVGYCFTTFY
jgi:hypothetical protein